MKTLAQVKIVEYHKGLAKAVAKMWNESRENWGGDSSVTTEQDVIEKEANSTNLHLFLALVGEEVVGYCGLSEYKEDEGALYIPLLNVHPAYHGLKIGKQLVLKAVEKTVSLNWPRLDLFTWPGNTKAVPLYKKCGFFWEDRDDTTHLMNFIPQILQVEGLRRFFEKHDWYATSQRLIEVKPDGIKENGHTFYEYRWKAGEEFVRIQIERTGRGIRLIETEDILIEMKLPNFKLLEKEDHLASYRVVNKRAEPLNVCIKGRSTDLIDHHFEEQVEVVNEWICDSPLIVSMPENEPSPWKTHPVVGADLFINGQLFPLKMGVFPKKAGTVQLRSTKRNWRVKEQGTLFIDIESQLDEKATWTITLPKNDVVNWEKAEINTLINGNARVSIPLTSELIKHGFLREELEVFVERSNGQSFSFVTRISLAFPGFGAKFGGETDEYWYGYNGPYYVEIEKRNHGVKIGSIHSSQEPMKFFSPKIGKPFSEEFAKKEATNVEFIERPEAFVVRTSLQSDAFLPLSLNTSFQILGDGLVEIYHQLLNEGEEEKKHIAVLLPLITKLNGLAIPQSSGVVKGEETTIPFMDYIRDKELTERWIFTSSDEGETFGLAWPKEALGRKDDWRFAIEYKLDHIGSKEEICLGPIQVGVNLSPTWSKWRELVVGEEASSMNELPLYGLKAKKGDFISSVGEVVDYSFYSMLTPYLQGKLALSHEGERMDKEVKKEASVTEINFQLDFHTTGVKEISGFFHSPSSSAKLHSLQLVKGKEKVKHFERDGNWTVDNGSISFSASASYFPGIYSLIYEGKETLHHQYPQAGPKAWWNPWGGGISYSLENVSLYSMLKEKTTIEPYSRTDEHGHSWTGLCLTTAFAEHETMKGVVLRQYALTLPEVPILVMFAEIDQDSKRTFTKEKLQFEAFLKPGETLSSCYAKLPTNGIYHTHYAGSEELLLKDTAYVTVGSSERQESLTIIHPKPKIKAGVYLNQEVFSVSSLYEWSASSGEVEVVKPTVLLFGKENVSSFIYPFQGLSFK